MEAERLFEKRPDLVTRTIAGETIIVPVSGRVCDLDSIYTLNEVGSLVWELIDGRTPPVEIARAVETEFEVDPATAAADVERFLESLRTSELIQPAAAEACA